MTLLDYAIEFLREADEIRMPATCHEADDGRLIVIEHRLIAVKRSDVAAAAASGSSAA
ncbi:MAG TPA: hypothetical protein VGS13_12595 [Stellaceae bacterium]|nr:hypothetical protein [Stellaceae bacterium]